MRSWFVLMMNSVLLGIGLAMDAFSVSVVNGMNAPKMPRGRMMLTAGIFGCFQMAMPLIGWVLVRTLMKLFQSLQTVIPWAAFALLLAIGINMIRERNEYQKEARPDIRLGSLLFQGVATSIDALSVGLAMAELTVGSALLQAGIIGAVTFGVCLTGIVLGKKIGIRIASHAGLIGGLILIGIGLEILLTHLIGG